MHAKYLLPWLASALTVTAVEFPTTIELDVVFPRNETYNSTQALPVAFAIQNAEAASELGYMMTWTVQTLGSGNVRQQEEQPDPADVVNNTWYKWGKVTTGDTEKSIEPGAYNLTVSFVIGSCTNGSSNVSVGAPRLEASVEFTVVDDGTGKDFDLTVCPQLLDTLTIERLNGPIATNAACPVRAEREPDNISDPCHARMSKSMADRVLANMTVQGFEDGSYNGFDLPAANDPASESTNDTSDTGTDAGSSGEENTGIRHYGPTVGTAILAGVVALFC